MAIGWFSAKRGTQVVAKYVDARLGKPSLVRETSRLSFFELFKHPIQSVKKVVCSVDDPLKGVVLSVRFIFKVLIRTDEVRNFSFIFFIY